MDKVILAGIDEAGRGAVIGPLVVAGVSIEQGREEEFRAMGAKDSKLLSPKRRVFLSKKIQEIAKDIVVLSISACKIDDYRNKGVNLNKIEAMRFADIINMLEPGIAYLDAPDVNIERLNLFIKKMLKQEVRLVSEHKADSTYPIVSAASIMAKVERDNAVEELKKKYGDIGPGYSSNPITRQWMKDWLEKHGDFPECVRKTWSTTSDIQGEMEQNKLDRFLGSKKT